MPVKKRKTIAANWKMTGNAAEWRELANGVAAGADDVEADFILCPPHPGLPIVAHILKERGSRVSLGGQDVSVHEPGAFTGDVSAEMLTDMGCSYCIIGHSERRENHKESHYDIAQKINRCLRKEITPILCVGETHLEKEAGNTINVLDEQFLGALNDIQLVESTQLILAYEPVWAISSVATGKGPTPEQLHEVFRFLRSSLIDKFGDIGYDIRMLYGGSVNPGNAAELLKEENIDGFLVGSASLKAEMFLNIGRAAGGQEMNTQEGAKAANA